MRVLFFKEGREVDGMDEGHKRCAVQHEELLLRGEFEGPWGYKQGGNGVDHAIGSVNVRFYELRCGDSRFVVRDSDLQLGSVNCGHWATVIYACRTTRVEGLTVQTFVKLVGIFHILHHNRVHVENACQIIYRKGTL